MGKETTKECDKKNEVDEFQARLQSSQQKIIKDDDSQVTMEDRQRKERNEKQMEFVKRLRLELASMVKYKDKSMPNVEHNSEQAVADESKKSTNVCKSIFGNGEDKMVKRRMHMDNMTDLNEQIESRHDNLSMRNNDECSSMKDVYIWEA